MTAQNTVFLSYGHDPDCTELANRLYGSLKSAGYQPWMDKPPDDQGGIAFNEDWRERIRSEIKGSSHMIALLSSHSTRKPGVCREEIALAIGPLNTRIYTVLVQPEKEVTPPLIVSRRQWLDMSTWRTVRDTGHLSFEAWYQNKFKEILQVLKENTNFAGDMEALAQWLRPNRQFSNRIEAEQGFVGRHWLLGGIGETSQTEIEGPDDQGSSAMLRDQADSRIGEIERWAIRKEDSRRVFWLCAPPGWGKSAVAARLAHAGGARVLAVHFCRYNEALTRDAREVIRSIAYQMASQLPDYRKALREIQQERGQPLSDYCAADLFHVLIKEPILGALVQTGRINEGRLLIVIDALDECVDEHGGSEFLDVLSQEFEGLPKWIGLVVTSRRDPAVIARFEKFGVFDLDAFENANRADIDTSLREWIHTRVNEGKLATDEAVHALARLATACQGNFQYLQTLKKATDLGEWRDNEPHLPKGFADLYRKWFARKFPAPHDFDATGKLLLQWMVAAREPLPAGLLERLEPDSRKRKQMLARVGSMLVTDHDGRLHFFHKSLAEWLGNNEQVHDNWIVDIRAGHAAIAAALSRQWCESSRSSDGYRFRAWPEDARGYALRHFPAHLRLADETRLPRLEDVLTDFEFALERCAGGATEELLDDFLGHDNARSLSELEPWRNCMAVSGYLLRQSSPSGMAHQVLLQVAMERAAGDPLRQCAFDWISKRQPEWAMLLREQPSSEPTGLVVTIDLAAQVAGDANEHGGSSSHASVQSMVVNWASRSVEVTIERAGAMEFDIDSGRRVRHFAGGSPALESDSQSHPTADKLETFPALPSPIRRRAASADGSVQVFACKDGSLWRHRTSTGECDVLEDRSVTSFNVTTGRSRSSRRSVYDVALSANGRFTAAVGEDGRLRVWRGSMLVHARVVHAYRATHVCLSPDARQALTAGHDSKLHLWDLSMPVIQEAASEVTALAEMSATAATPARIASADAGGEICIRDAATLAPIPGLRWQAHDTRIWDLVVARSGSWLVSAGDDGKVCIWDAYSGACIAVHEPKSPRRTSCRALAISHDGRILVAAIGSVIKAWELPLTFVAAQLPDPLWSRDTGKAHGSDIRALFLTQTDLLVVAAEDAKVCIVSARNGSTLSEPDHGAASARAAGMATGALARSRGVYALAVSVCGRFLACAGRGQDRAISLWNIIDPMQPRLVNVLHGHLRGPHFLAFTPDGEQLWSGSWDQTLVLWDWRATQNPRELVRPVAKLSVALQGFSGRLIVGTATGDVGSLILRQP